MSMSEIMNLIDEVSG